MIDSAIYEKYKPLRNFLRNLGMENSLYVIWAYINLLQFDKTLPTDVIANPAFLNKLNHPERGLYEWELALLAREVIKNSQYRPRAVEVDLRKWGNLSKAVNKLKFFENDVWPVHGDDHNILTELRRIAHRQFPWQSRQNTSLFLRYFKIYSHPNLNKVVQARFNITIQKWYLIGFALFGVFLAHPRITNAPNIQLKGISKEDVEAFIKVTKIDLKNLKELIEQNIQYDDEFVYTLNPLEYYPIIKSGEQYLCPVINFLGWRITSGIYFDLVKDKQFGHPFGMAFQNYIEEVSTVILYGSNISVIPEQKYHVGKKEKDSVDLILAMDDAALFVEVKAKRMQVRSKSQLISTEAIEKDIAKLANDVAQTYRTISDYQNGHYTHFIKQDSINIFPFVVTLEDWYLLGDDLQALKVAVHQQLNKLNLPSDYLKEMPFTICSSDTYEYFMQIIHKHGITKVMNDWHKTDLDDHDFGQHIRTTYTDEYEQLTKFFPNEAKKIFQV